MSLKYFSERSSVRRLPGRPFRELTASAPAAPQFRLAMADYEAAADFDGSTSREIYKVPEPELAEPVVAIARPKPPRVAAPAVALAKPAELLPILRPLDRILTFLRRGAATPKRLRVVETAALGEKRFLAIVQAEDRRFLVASGPAGISLLTRLDEAGKTTCEIDSQPVTVELAG